MDRQLCHPNRLQHFFCHLISYKHLDLDFRAPWLKIDQRQTTTQYTKYRDNRDELDVVRSAPHLG